MLHLGFYAVFLSCALVNGDEANGSLAKQQASENWLFRIESKASNRESFGKIRVQTGFALRSHRGILTALHGVLDCTQPIKAYCANGTLAHANLSVALVDVEHDLALLTPSLTTDAMWPEDFGLLLGSPSDLHNKLRLHGYPSAIKKALVTNDVSVRNLHDPYRKWQDMDATSIASIASRGSPSLARRMLDLDVTASPGHSGGPVIDSVSERVVGVIIGGLAGTNITLAAPAWDVELKSVSAEEVRDALSELSSKSVLGLFETETRDCELIEFELQQGKKKQCGIHEVLYAAPYSRGTNRVHVLWIIPLTGEARPAEVLELRMDGPPIPSALLGRCLLIEPSSTSPSSVVVRVEKG